MSNLSPAQADGPEDGGLRRILNRNPVITAAIGIIAIGAALGMAFWPGGNNGDGAGFYTTDDGATYFQTTPRLPPFDHGGAEAVQAVLFRTDGGKPFVGYLQKFTPEGKKAIDELNKKGRKPGPIGLQIKKPGDPQWLAADDPKNAAKIAEIRRVKSPDGQPVFMIVE
jgi:hypothetical protein